MRLPFPPPCGAARLRAPAIGGALALCGLVVGVVIGRETGGLGLLVGLGLALLPLPVLFAAYHWLEAVHPRGWRELAFAFGWGACVATLLALAANGLLVRLLTDSPARLSPSNPDTLEITVIAPMVEETAKAAVVGWVWLRQTHLGHGVLVGLATTGASAAGFAFTENVLYLGSAFAQDQELGQQGIWDSAIAVTFFVRMVVAPFAHPMFTAVTGLGFGLAAMLAPGRRRLRLALPALGLGLAMGLHSLWNASTSLSLLGFGAVYLLLMAPTLVLLCRVAVSARRRELRVVRRTLTHYAAAGWLAPQEPQALGCARARARARRLGRRAHGPAGARAVADYQAAATELALLRDRATRGLTSGDFAARERDLLRRLWTHRPLAAPLTLAPDER